MSENKRYYWLKLNENFFEDDTIAWLEEQENGKDYVIFYLKLALRSLKDDGKLIRYVGETLMPYDTKALSRLTNTNIDTVNTAMTAFEQIGLTERLETGEIFMKQIDEMIGSETDAAKRKRKQRAREAQLTTDEQEKISICDNVTDVSQESHTEIELDIDKELEKDKEEEQEKKTGRKYSFDDTQFELAKLLWEKIKTNFPNNKEPNLEAWANDIRLMMEQDNRSVAEIKGVIEWSQKHEFWYANIQSARKLREKYETMYAQADREKNQNKPKVRKKETLPDWATEDTSNDEELVSKQEQEEFKKRLEASRAMKAGRDS